MTESQGYGITAKTAFILVSFSIGSLGDGLNIFQAIYLNCIGWKEGSIGIALSAMGFSSIIVQTLAGDLIDKTSRDRRYFLGISSIISAISSLAILFVREGNNDHTLMFISKIIQGISTTFIQPSLAAVTLATFGPKHFDHIMASNIFWGHLGGFFSAVVAGIIAFVFYPNIKACFLVNGVSVILAVFFILFLPIGDPSMGRGFHGKREHLLDEDGKEKNINTNPKAEYSGTNCSIDEIKSKPVELQAIQEPATYWSVFTDPATASFCMTCFFFHFANASVLITLGELMGGENEDGSVNRSAIPLTSGAIVTAQITMAIITVIGDNLTKRGFKRKPLLMIGLLSLTLRCILIMYWQNAGEAYLLSTQFLDGIGAGFHGLLVPYLVADITFGTGRFNVIMGLVGTTSGIGASLSNLIGQSLVENYGYNASLLGSLGLSIIACIVFAVFMPETYGLRGVIGDNLTQPNQIKESIEMT